MKHTALHVVTGYWTSKTSLIQASLFDTASDCQRMKYIVQKSDITRPPSSTSAGNPPIHREKCFEEKTCLLADMKSSPCPWGFAFLKLRINLQLWAGEQAGAHSILWVYPPGKSLHTRTTSQTYLQLVPSLPHSMSMLKSPRWVTPTQSGLSTN